MREELRIPKPGDADYEVGDLTKFALKKTAAIFNKGSMAVEQQKNGYQFGDHSRKLFKSLKAVAESDAAPEPKQSAAASEANAGEDIVAEVENALHLRYLCRSMSNYRNLAEYFQEFSELGVEPLLKGDSSVDAAMALQAMQTLNPSHSSDTSIQEAQTAQEVVIRSLNGALKMTRREIGKLLLFGNPSIKECFKHVGSKQWEPRAMLKKILDTIDAQLGALFDWGGVEHSDVMRILVRTALGPLDLCTELTAPYVLYVLVAVAACDCSGRRVPSTALLLPTPMIYASGSGGRTPGAWASKP